MPGYEAVWFEAAGGPQPDLMFRKMRAKARVAEIAAAERQQRVATRLRHVVENI
jgi:hypothetical protein